MTKFIRNLLNSKELAVSHFELEIRRHTLNLRLNPIKMVADVLIAIGVVGLSMKSAPTEYGAICQFMDARFCFGIAPKKSCAGFMGESRKTFHGLTLTVESHTVLNTPCWFIAR